MKLSLAALTLLVCLMTSPAFAQGSAGVPTTVTPKTEWSLTTGFGYYDKYYGSTAAATFTEDAVGQWFVDLNGRRGKVSWTLEYFESKSTSHNWSNFGDEVDLVGTIGRSTKAGDVTATFGHYFVVPQAGSDIETVSFGFSKTLNIDDKRTVTPFVKSETYWPTNENGPKGGTFVTTGATYGRKAGALSWSAKAEVTRDIHGAFGFQKGWLYKGEARVTANVGEWNVGPVFRYGGAFTDVSRPGTFSCGFTVVRTFSLSRGGPK